MSEKKITIMQKLTSKNIEKFNDNLSDEGYCDFSEYKERFLKHFNAHLKEYYEDFEGYFSDSESDSPSSEESDSESNSSSSEEFDFLSTNDLNKKVTYIDLCCGMGSFHYSFRKNGWKCVMACDINNKARGTYKLNYDIEPKGDIYDIIPSSIPKYDILCAGFPCQSFSQSGKQKGFKDKRGLLFFEIMKFVKFHKPKIIIFENVPALLKHDNSKTFSIIKKTIEEEKYNVVHKIIKCSDYGIPQMRKRLFIIGVRNDITYNGDINSILDFEKYKKNITLKEYLGLNFEKKTAYTIRCGGKHSPIDDRHNWDGYWVDEKEYRLTIKDALKLQGFDENFKLYGSKNDKWKQLGNTIPTIFTEMISLNIQELL